MEAEHSFLQLEEWSRSARGEGRSGGRGARWRRGYRGLTDFICALIIRNIGY